jgi:D-glycero-D-manno-heptose 1,7-bisphosphate phosphatase
VGIDEVKRRAVFLDRDGVINAAVVRDGKPFPPASNEALVVIDGVADALLRLREAGYLLIVITNQPDVARGTQRIEELDAMHDRLRRELALDEIIACCHDGDSCDCRKPKPGALIEAAKRHDLDLAASFMVGDRWRDIEAAQRAGVTAFFIDYEYSERQPEAPFIRVTSLADAAERILGEQVQEEIA